MRITLFRLGGFAALGLCLLLIRGWWQPEPQRPTVQLSAERLQAEERRWQQTMGRQPDAAERETIARETANDEVLFREALRMGLHRRDPVVISRLVRNMRFVEGDEESSETPQRLLELAYELDMHRTDVVVRRRLVQVLYDRMLLAAKPDEPTPKQVLAHIDAHPERFSTRPTVSFSHVYLNPKRAGWTAESAKLLLDELRVGNLAPREAVRLGDPLPTVRHLVDQTPHEISKRFGPRLGPALLEAESGRWSGPYRTQLGEHLIWVEDVNPARLVLDERTLSSARHELLQQRKERLVDDALAKLRDDYEVNVHAGNRAANGVGIKAS
jgi:hypothetical protein